MQQLKAGTPLPFETCENFRELGGYVGKNGKKVKHGVFFRTGALSLVCTPKDIELYRSYNIKTVMDFRSEPERLAHPDPILNGENNIAISAMFDSEGNELRFDLAEIFAAGEKGIEEMLKNVDDAYLNMPFNNPAYKRMFAEIKMGNVPLLFHCSAGKDRTGVAAALILRTLGVSDEDIITDYEITNVCRPNTRKDFGEKYGKHFVKNGVDNMVQCILGVDKQMLINAFKAIDEKYQSFEDYLLAECGMNKDDVLKMQEDYLC